MHKFFKTISIKKLIQIHQNLNYILNIYTISNHLIGENLILIINNIKNTLKFYVNDMNSKYRKLFGFYLCKQNKFKIAY